MTTEFAPLPENEFREGLPKFVKGWAIADLVFCSLRTLQSLISLLVWLVIVLVPSLGGQQFSGYIAVEAALFGVLGLVGLAANIALLLHLRWGVVCGWICAGLTAASILQQIICAFLIPQDGDTAQTIGMVFGVVFGSVCRLVLLAIYCLVLVRARQFFLAGDRAGMGVGEA